ncbi:MAG TPA: helix-turn-helix domain-containing protein [Gemmatimonadales bacterium]|nr:helix-turn-helix domain-containing protein [Gemmatimonadales bacterium]
MGKVSPVTSGERLPSRTREPDARKSYNHPCTIARTLDILGDRWTLLILRDLMGGLRRYSDILESCNGMSPNVLSDRLKRLEADGLVHREYHRELPPRVDYTLTEKGWAVRPIFLALIDWGQEFLPATITEESVGTSVPTDFAVRIIPTFSFKPERASELSATMVVEISDCEDCNTWTLAIHDGHIHPQRTGIPQADVVLKTNTRGFFRFIRNKAKPEECGEIVGPVELAAAIQACFVSD